MMATSFDRAMRWLMRPDVEKGWYAGDKPHDPNPTLDGVTQKTYDKWRIGTGLDRRSVRQMEPSERDSIYRTLYWTKGKCEKVSQKSETISIIHFDACVNHGVASPNDDRSAGAIELLQRALGVEDDGIFGPITWENFVSELIEDGEAELAKRYLKSREGQYRYLAKMAPQKHGLSLNGWLARLRRLKEFLAL